MIEELWLHFGLNLAFSLFVFILEMVSGNEPCKKGWDRKQFMYIIFGLFFIEALIALLQIICIKSKYGESKFLIFLRIINYFNRIGYFIYGTVRNFQDSDYSDCNIHSTIAFLVIVFGFCWLLQFFFILIPYICPSYLILLLSLAIESTAVDPFGTSVFEKSIQIKVR
jgi:hypothetical protein